MVYGIIAGESVASKCVRIICGSRFSLASHPLHDTCANEWFENETKLNRVVMRFSIQPNNRHFSHSVSLKQRASYPTLNVYFHIL